MKLWIGLALLGGLLVLAGGNGGSDRTTEDPTSLAKQDKDKDVKEKKDPSKKDTIEEYVQSVIKGRSPAHKGSFKAKKKESIKAKVERTIDENGDDLLKDARRQAMEKDKAPFKESPSLLSMNALDAVLQETGFNSLRAFDKAVARRNRDNYNMMSWLSVDTLKKLADYRTAIKEELD